MTVYIQLPIHLYVCVFALVCVRVAAEIKTLGYPGRGSLVAFQLLARLKGYVCQNVEQLGDIHEQ